MGLPKLASVNRAARISFLESPSGQHYIPGCLLSRQSGAVSHPGRPQWSSQGRTAPHPEPQPRNLPWRAAISPTSLPRFPSWRPIFLLLLPCFDCPAGTGSTVELSFTQLAVCVIVSSPGHRRVLQPIQSAVRDDPAHAGLQPGERRLDHQPFGQVHTSFRIWGSTSSSVCSEAHRLQPPLESFLVDRSQAPRNTSSSTSLGGTA
jgi:hypothetical protein